MSITTVKCEHLTTVRMLEPLLQFYKRAGVLYRTKNESFHQFIGQVKMNSATT